MNRLLSEWQRLYAAGPDRAWADPQGQVRALVLELSRPADWRTLSRAWQGVQADLALPAPAIAVTGRDGYQLWFSLDQAIPLPHATAFLASLQARYLADVPPERVRLWPMADEQAPHGWRHTAPLPALDGQAVCPDQWAAFVAPDLAPVFNDTPWLDLPPNLEGQADLLSRLRSVSAAEWQTACAQLNPLPTTTASHPTREASTSPDSLPSAPDARHVPPHTDPHSFLLSVMNNVALDMALRIEAAKALLPFTPQR